MAEHRIARRVAVGWVFAIACLFLSACGAGVAGVVASAGGNGGGTTPALDAFRVESPKVSPSHLFLDASQAVRVGLFYDLGAGPQPMTKLQGIAGNEVDLPATEVELRWDFASELGRTSFTPGVKLIAMRGGAPISGGELTLSPGLGNDAPVVEQAGAPPASEVAGIVALRLRVSDSSGDAVKIRAEFDVVGDVPDAGWRSARPGGLLPGEPTPDFAFTGVIAPSSPGVDLDFFWNTDVDLKDLERDARLRFTAVDPALVESAPRETIVFHVDNNAPPIVQLQNDLVISNPDERRGIPIPFRVIDEEGDLVEVIFQWRREGEEFPELPDDDAELDAILADPVQRRERHVCTPYPRYASGRAIPIDATHGRLPELAARESWILASGLEGKTLELMRDSTIPEPITPTWSSNTLVSPVAALPLGDGLTALVLDVPGSGRLREIELATGRVVRGIAELGPGIPSAMAFEVVPEGNSFPPRAVLVPIDDAGTWRIVRIELASGALTELAVSDGTQPAPVHGIASLGESAAVFTAGSALLLLDYRDPLAPRLSTLLIDLATPWGVAVDPLASNKVYVAERDADRILAFELDSHGKHAVIASGASPPAISRPTAIAHEDRGTRILAVTNTTAGASMLIGLDLGATGRNVVFSIGVQQSSGISSIATGPDGLRIACVPPIDRLLVGGGLEQRRAIVAYEHFDAAARTGQVAALDMALEPGMRPSQPWRIAPDRVTLRAGSEGVARSFVWSSDSDVISAGPAFLRATPRDDEFGVSVEGSAPKRLSASLDGVPIRLGSVSETNGPSHVAAADLDGDGDQDLISTNFRGDNLTLFFQGSPAAFGAPLVLGGSATTDGASSAAVADLDADGDQDLVSANTAADNLTIFFQSSPGAFVSPPLAVGGPATTDGPHVVSADLDGDGDQDLVSANAGGDNLTIFFQDSPGLFSSTPLVLSDPGRINFPTSMTAADLDGDGDLDLASGSLFGTDVTVFFQSAPGVFAGTPLALRSPFSSSVAAADMNGDGANDLISAEFPDVTIFSQESPGTFMRETSVDTPAVSVTAADLDGDGDQDLVSAGGSSHNLTIIFQEAAGSFGSQLLELGGLPTTNQPGSVAAADLDGDGGQDLVAANSAGNDLTIFFHRLPGNFEHVELLEAVGSFLTVADLDADGDHDLASTEQFNLNVFFQDAGGFAGQDLPHCSDCEHSSVCAADLDGDGDQDIVSAVYNDLGLASLFVFFQNSAGAFVSPPLALTGGDIAEEITRLIWVAAADLDADGDMDLASANNESGNNLTVFFQDAPGVFPSPPLALSGGIRPAFVTAADLDDDGDQDLVSVNEGDANLSIFYQGPPGRFSGASFIRSSPTTNNVVAADLDGDGDQDLVSGQSSRLTVFFQRAPRSFGSQPLVLGDTATTRGVRWVTAADLDSDGDQDLVSANEVGDNLTVFLQNLLGTFASPPLMLGSPIVTDQVTFVTAADLDGDGDQDLVTTSGSTLDSAVFWGGR